MLCSNIRIIIPTKEKAMEWTNLMNWYRQGSIIFAWGWSTLMDPGPVPFYRTRPPLLSKLAPTHDRLFMRPAAPLVIAVLVQKSYCNARCQCVWSYWYQNGLPHNYNQSPKISTNDIFCTSSGGTFSIWLKSHGVFMEHNGRPLCQDVYNNFVCSQKSWGPCWSINLCQLYW